MGSQNLKEQSGEYIYSTPLIGIIIGAFAGGICFVVFALRRVIYAGGVSVVFILNKLRGKPIGQSPLVRIIIAAGIILCAVSGMAAAIFLGSVVGGVIEYALMKLT
jgi:hypothetical protein